MQALKCIVDSKIHQQTWKWIYISRQRIWKCYKSKSTCAHWSNRWG